MGQLMPLQFAKMERLRKRWAVYCALFLVLFLGATSIDRFSDNLNSLNFWHNATRSVLAEGGQQYYSFFGIEPFGKVDLTRAGEISAQEFERIVLDSVPFDMRRRVEKYISTTLQFAAKYQVDPFWVLAIMWTESHFRSNAKSYVRATGLMQIMPQTGHFLSKAMKRPIPAAMVRELINDPVVNIEMGVFYLKTLLERFNDNYRLATVAYNMGPGRVKKRLERRLDVGVRNRYLNRVRRAYVRLSYYYVKHVMSIPHPYNATYVVNDRTHDDEWAFSAVWEQFPHLYAMDDHGNSSNIVLL